MVIVHEVRDEDFDAQLAGVNSDEYTTDDETFSNGPSAQRAWNPSRFLPLGLRKRVSAWSRGAWSSAGRIAQWVGRAAWIITTSMLLVGLPLLYVYDQEKSLVEYEKEQQRFAPPVAADASK